MNRRRLISLLGLGMLLVLLVGCKRASRTSNAPPPHPTQDIVVDGTIIIYNGQRLELGAPLSAWIPVLGPPSRDEHETLTWDDHGVFCNLPWPAPKVDGGAGSRPVKALTVVFGASPFTANGHPIDYWPRHPFRGRLVVDGAWVHRGTTPDEINEHKKGPSFREGYVPSVSFAEQLGIKTEFLEITPQHRVLSYYVALDSSTK
jgi:hypothetical protein